MLKNCLNCFFIKISKITRFLRTFCDQTTIHGVRYITERNRHWTEKLWWSIAIGVSLFFCIWSIMVIWVSWHERPVRIVTSESGQSITTIPFPTVTICSKTKATRAKLDLSSLHPYRPLAESNMKDKRFQTLAHICPLFPLYGSFDDKITNESIYDMMMDIAPTIDILIACVWRNQLLPCSNIFVPILTEYGLCYAFNALNSRDIYTNEMAARMMMVKNNPSMTNWSIGNGYGESFSVNDYPRRTSNSGYRSGLVVALKMNAEDLNYMCQSTGLGFMVTLTTPIESNELSTNLFQVPLSESTVIAITPQIKTTSEKLRKYSARDRHCYFHNERKLRFFKYYTQRNCHAECLANFTVQLCGCVRFSMPRDQNTIICGAGNILCYLSSENQLFEEHVNGETITSRAELFRSKCNCLPACFSIDYEANVDHIRYDMDILQKAGIGIDSRPARLSISFRDHTAQSQQRVETMTFADFLAGCGGLLGLFLGVSALSIVELVYFFTLRLFWNIRRSNDVLPFHN